MVFHCLCTNFNFFKITFKKQYKHFRNSIFHIKLFLKRPKPRNIPRPLSVLTLSHSQPAAGCRRQSAASSSLAVPHTFGSCRFSSSVYLFIDCWVYVHWILVFAFYVFDEMHSQLSYLTIFNCFCLLVRK